MSTVCRSVCFNIRADSEHVQRTCSNLHTLHAISQYVQCWMCANNTHYHRRWACACFCAVLRRCVCEVGVEMSRTLRDRLRGDVSPWGATPPSLMTHWQTETDRALKIQHPISARWTRWRQGAKGREDPFVFRTLQARYIQMFPQILNKFSQKFNKKGVNYIYVNVLKMAQDNRKSTCNNFITANTSLNLFPVSQLL